MWNGFFYTENDTNWRYNTVNDPIYAVPNLLLCCYQAQKCCLRARSQVLFVVLATQGQYDTALVL